MRAFSEVDRRSARRLARYAGGRLRAVFARSFFQLMRWYSTWCWRSKVMSRCGAPLNASGGCSSCPAKIGKPRKFSERKSF